jgi:hypothetical protein
MANSHNPSFAKKAVAQARKCDQRLQDFLGNPRLDNEKDYQDLVTRVEGLDLKDQTTLRRILQSQADAYEQLVLPAGYKEFMVDIHNRAWEKFRETPIAKEMLPKWQVLALEFVDVQSGEIRTRAKDNEILFVSNKNEITDQARKRLDNAGITFDKSLELMNAASAAMYEAWKDRLGLKTQTPPLRFRKPPFSRTDSLSGVSKDKDKIALFDIGDLHYAMLDFRFLIHIAFHEPQHGIQKLIKEYTDANAVPEKDRELFLQMSEIFGVGNMCSSSTFHKTKELDLRKEAYAAYRISPRERAAHQQGFLAELSFSKEGGIPLKPETRDFFSRNSLRVKALPPDLRDWFHKHYVIHDLTEKTTSDGSMRERIRPTARKRKTSPNP